MNQLTQAREWWNDKSEDDQMFLMMRHGFTIPFNPSRVTITEIQNMYKLEQS